MNMKKITAIAAAFVMAAGIVTGVPMSTEATSPLAITAEAADSDFVIKTDKDGDKYLAEYKGKGGDITIPKEATYIGEKVFYGNDKITSVTIPKTCYDAVSHYAFAECANLKKVVIEGDIAILTGAFEYCINLESVTVNGSIRIIEGGAFRDCEKLKTVKISGNKYDFLIGAYAFYNCYSLTSINIPSKCTEIYGRAFLNCFSLTKLTIPAKTKINTEKVGEDYGYGECHFGYAYTEADVGYMTFVADGKQIGYIQRIISKEEAVKKGTPYTKVSPSGVLVICREYETVTPKQLTLTVTKGSPAEKWAKENGVKYVYAGSSSTTTTTPNSTNSSKLAAPTGIKGTVSEDKIVLKWNNVSGAKAYRVYKYDSKTGKYLKYKDVGGTQCTVTGLKSGTKYSFKIYALTSENGKFVPQTSSKAVAFTTKEYNIELITM